MIKKTLTILFIALATIVNAQNTLKATIQDAESKEVLIGATILLKGTTNGISSDDKGNVILKNIPIFLISKI